VLRNAIFALLWLLLASAACAQDWALKMFEATAHDFGTVAKGSQAEYRFRLKNLYEEDLRIVSVTSSCGCTTSRVSKRDLKTFEAADIIADFNTRDFQGHKSATITVVLECVSHAEVQLRVTGYIRPDVVTQPGAVDFGTVEQGGVSEQKLHVSYAGRDDWKILDARTADPWYEVEMTEVARGGGRVAYDLLVRLTKNAPVGYIKDQLILVTNDAQARELPIDMHGRVASDITISPTKLFIGVVRPGQKVTKNLVVRGRKPFRIVDVDCPDKCFHIEPTQEAKSVHLLPVVFTAGQEAGRVKQTIGLRTDLGDVVQAFTAFAEVVQPEATPPLEPVGKPRPDTSSAP
jgi:hypothetical protein